MSDQTLIILRICLLALVYLTFFRVLRAVWVELRAETPRPAPVPLAVPQPAAAAVPLPVPAAPPTHTSASQIGARLIVIAPPTLAGTVFALGAETTIGRAAGCGVVIDDARVSKLHARLFLAAQKWMVEDLGSTNGTILNGDVLGQARPIQAGDRVQVGDVVMEFA